MRIVLLTGILPDKYTDITTELASRGPYCDVALKINDKISVLIEATEMGEDLK